MTHVERIRTGALLTAFALSTAFLFSVSPDRIEEIVRLFPIRFAAETLTAEETVEAQPAELNFDGVQLDVSPVLQLPEMPNGCETSSLTALLNYYGYPVTKEELASEYLPYEYFTFDDLVAVAPDPEDAYAGDPFGEAYAFYCFSRPIVLATNRYLISQNSEYRAQDATGSTAEDLVDFLREGRPVIVWATLHFEKPELSGFWWRTPDGEIIEAYSNLHCLLLTGYDGISVHLCDPLVGRILVSADKFFACYEEMGRRAVVLNTAPEGI